MFKENFCEEETIHASSNNLDLNKETNKEKKEDHTYN